MISDKSRLRIGLIGFGCVGQGLYDILQKLPEFGAVVKRIAVKSPTKPRTLPAGRFDFHADDLLTDPDLDVLVEVIDDADEAFRLVSTALRHGRQIVTANKAMVARHLPELVQLQQHYGGTLLYEASVCGSIPIIRTLESYFGSEPLHRVGGIFNGSSNYVLSRMSEEGSGYSAALAEAQALGFAETDPTLDMGAFDPRSKAVILAVHAYGLLLYPDQVLNLGIENITAQDIQQAAAGGQKIKVVASLQRLEDGRITVLVTPQFVSAESPFYTVEREFNGVVIEAAFADAQFLRGRGAGGHPTGSAVLADLAALRQGYRYAYHKHSSPTAPIYTTNYEVEVCVRGANPTLLQALGLQNGVAQNSPDSAYATGFVHLETLLQLRDELRQQGVFLVRTGEIRFAAGGQKQEQAPVELAF
ncbi:homoserine dehydrogenase [Hymenobacter sp. HD11105]